MNPKRPGRACKQCGQLVPLVQSYFCSLQCFRDLRDSANVDGPMAFARSVQDCLNVTQAIRGADVLVGHSWGGAVVIRAGERPDVRGVVTIDPMIVRVGTTSTSRS